LAEDAPCVFLPLTAQLKQMTLSLMGDRKRELDHSAIATFLEELSHAAIKRPSEEL